MDEQSINQDVNAGAQSRILEAILSAVTDLISVHDRAGRCLYVGSAGARAMGLRREDLIGRIGQEIGAPAEIVAQFDARRETVFRTGQRLTGALRYPTVTGERDYEFVLAPIQGEDGVVEAVVTTFQDVHDRNAAERTARESELRFRTLFERSRDALGVSARGKHVYVNPAYVRMYGYAQANDLIGTSVLERVTPAERERIRIRGERRAQGLPEPEIYHSRGLRADGEEFDLENSITLYDWQGEQYTLVIQRDITAQRQAAEALRKSEGHFRMLADMVPQMVWLTRPDGVPDYFNQRWYDYTGHTLQETIDLGWPYFLPPDDVPAAVRAWTDAVETGLTYEVEYHLRGADGRCRWFLARGVPLTDDQGQVIRWFGTCTDIHDQKEAEETQRFLAEMSERMRLAGNPEEMLWEVVSALGQHLRVSRCAYGAVDAQADRITVTRDYCDGATSMAGTYPRSGFGGQIAGDMALGRIVVNRDARADPRTAAHYDSVYGPLGIQASINVPILQDGLQVATLAVQQSDRPRDWTAAEIALVETIAERTGLALENARLYRHAEEAAAHQRAFLRDVLASVTEGRLRLCDAAATLPQALTPFGARVPLTQTSGPAELRRHAREAAAATGLAPERRHDLETAVGEAAMNAVMHAGGGTGQVFIDSRGAVQVRIEDQGEGIAVEKLPQATLARGYSTKATLGHGFKMMLQTADRIWLLTGASGTTVVLEQDRSAPSSIW